jgi:hypothetical protein
MASSEVEIINAAGSRIGQTAMLDSEVALADQPRSELATQGALWYPKVRDRLLRWRAFPWPFATIREQLALVAGETRTDWDYVYAYPADALAVRYVVPPAVRNPRRDQMVAHKIEARRDTTAEEKPIVGKLILCDQENAEIAYTFRVENPAVFDPDFESALEFELAGELARAIPKDEVLALKMQQLAQGALREAAAAALNEQKDAVEPDGEFITSRGATRRLGQRVR